jgi:hypothetical protein
VRESEGASASRGVPHSSCGVVSMYESRFTLCECACLHAPTHKRTHGCRSVMIWLAAEQNGSVTFRLDATI